MLLDSISFGINEGDKIGLIAKNGTGKTTLLRIIAGKEEADSGTIVFRNDLRLAILEQNPVFADDSVTAANAAPELGDDASETHSRYIRLLSGLGVNDTSVPLAKMSGGQRKRVAMARAIATEPQLLILDEPTNHLDITAIEWLEAYLAKARMTLLMVTHDRYFLDRVCSKIIEIDRTHIYTLTTAITITSCADVPNVSAPCPPNWTASTTCCARNKIGCRDNRKLAPARPDTA